MESVCSQIATELEQNGTERNGTERNRTDSIMYRELKKQTVYMFREL